MSEQTTAEEIEMYEKALASFRRRGLEIQVSITQFEMLLDALKHKRGMECRDA